MWAQKHLMNSFKSFPLHLQSNTHYKQSWHVLLSRHRKTRTLRIALTSFNGHLWIAFDLTYVSETMRQHNLYNVDFFHIFRSATIDLDFKGSGTKTMRQQNIYNVDFFPHIFRPATIDLDFKGNDTNICRPWSLSKSTRCNG